MAPNAGNPLLLRIQPPSQSIEVGNKLCALGNGIRDTVAGSFRLETVYGIRFFLNRCADGYHESLNFRAGEGEFHWLDCIAGPDSAVRQFRRWKQRIVPYQASSYALRREAPEMRKRMEREGVGSPPY